MINIRVPNDYNLCDILTGTYYISKPLAFTDANLSVQYHNILAEKMKKKQKPQDKRSHTHTHTHTQLKIENGMKTVNRG